MTILAFATLVVASYSMALWVMLAATRAEAHGLILVPTIVGLPLLAGALSVAVIA